VTLSDSWPVALSAKGPEKYAPAVPHAPGAIQSIERKTVMKKKTPKSKVQGPKSARPRFLPGAGLQVGGSAAGWIAEAITDQFREKHLDLIPVDVVGQIMQVADLFRAYAYHCEAGSRLRFLVRGIKVPPDRGEHSMSIIGLGDFEKGP